MAAKTRTSIQQLSKWASKPELMERFIQVALLSQRTLFIREVLLLEDESDAMIRMQVQYVCEQHGVETVFPRGNSYAGIHIKSLTPIQRLHATYLINLMRGSETSGLTFADGIRADEMLDRLIVCFRKYLGLYKLQAHTAPISFERFHFLYKCYKNGAIDLTRCTDCESDFVNLRVHQSVQCPLCERMQLVRMPNSGRFTSLIKNDSSRAAAG